jgi:hypothetical protein
MSSDERLDRAAGIIAQARAECLKHGVSLQEIAALLLDDAVLALYAEGRSRREASQFFRDFMQRRVPHWYAILPQQDP